MTNREKWRRAIVLIAAAMVVLLVLHPPWAFETVHKPWESGTPITITHSAGHGWLWDSRGDHVDYGFLAIELGAVAVAAGALLFALREK